MEAQTSGVAHIELSISSGVMFPTTSLQHDDVTLSHHHNVSLEPFSGCKTLVFLRNRRSRFFLPVKHNSFGGYVVEYCMLDTGCNTTLLPIPDDESLMRILGAFPIDKYIWEISSGGGVAAVQSPVLQIKSMLPSERILVKLGEGNSKVHGVYICELDSLRFHVSHADATRIIGLGEHVTKSIVCIDRLSEFVATMEALVSIGMSSKDIAGRRKHALIGQGLISDLSLLQSRKVSILTDHPISSSDTDRIISIANESDSVMRRSFFHNGKEFDDLEDDDHDGDYVNGHMYPMDE